MLRKLVSHLLAPAEAPAAAAPKADDLNTFGAGAEPGSSGGPPNSLGDWMKTVGSLDEEPAAEPDKGKEPDGQDGAAEPGDVDRNKVVDDTAAADAAKAKADADAKTAEEAAAAVKAKADAEGKESDDDKMPRSRQDWDKFKAKRQERETALKKDIEARDTRVKELEAKFTEVETKLKEKPPVDPEVETRSKQLEAENKALTEKIIELDVTQHPRFKAFYDGGTDKLIGNAKKLVGTDRADAIEKILKLPDGEYKRVQLREFISEMDDDLDKQQLGSIVIKMNDLNEDREAEVQKAAQHKDKLVGQRQAAAVVQQKALQTAFENTFKQLQDPKDGMVVYQKREGDAAWNAQVDKLKDTAAKILSSNNLKPETIARLTFDALALSPVLQTFHTKMTEWNAEKAKFEAQIKELTAAQPGGRGAGTGNGAPNNGAARKPIYKDGMTPLDASKAFAQSMVDAANEAG